MKKQLLLLALLTVLFSLCITLIAETYNSFDSFIYALFMTAGLQCLQLTLAFLPWWMYLYYGRKRKPQPSLPSSIGALLALFNFVVLIAALPDYSRASMQGGATTGPDLVGYLYITEGPAFLQATLYAFALPLGTFFLNHSYHQ